MRKSLILAGLVLATLLLAAPVAAQEGPPPPPPGGPPGPGMMGGPGMGPPPEAALKEALGLTDAQMDGLKALQDSARQKAQSVMPQLREAEKALHDAMTSSTADASQLGALQLTVKGYRDQLKAIDETVASGFRDLLTEDQKAKLNQYVAMEDALPVLMAIQRMHL